MWKWAASLSIGFCSSFCLGFLGGSVDTSKLTAMDLPNLNQGVCDDFSGTWKGTCTQKGMGKDEVGNVTLTVTQNLCELVEYGSQKHQMGKLFHKTKEMDDGIMHISVGAVWSQDGKTLYSFSQMSGAGTSKSGFAATASVSNSSLKLVPCGDDVCLEKNTEMTMDPKMLPYVTKPGNGPVTLTHECTFKKHLD